MLQPPALRLCTFPPHRLIKWATTLSLSVSMSYQFTPLPPNPTLVFLLGLLSGWLTGVLWNQQRPSLCGWGGSTSSPCPLQITGTLCPCDTTCDQKLHYLWLVSLPCLHGLSRSHSSPPLLLLCPSSLFQPFWLEVYKLHKLYDISYMI